MDSLDSSAFETCDLVLSILCSRDSRYALRSRTFWIDCMMWFWEEGRGAALALGGLEYLLLEPQPAVFS